MIARDLNLPTEELLVTDLNDSFLRWFRTTMPYINAHRGKTFVVGFGGEAVLHPHFEDIIHDLTLLHSLGIQLVVVHGMRPQIEQRLEKTQLPSKYHQGVRVTETAALPFVLEAAGVTRMTIEAQLSMGLINSPMHNASVRVCSGNFVVAKPYGTRDGVDYCHTGEVRRIEQKSMQQHLAAGEMVLLSPIGYSPTGETFNLAWEEVAQAAAQALQADKLFLLTDGAIQNAQGELIRELNLVTAKQQLMTSDSLKIPLQAAIAACENGVQRCHLVSLEIRGGLLHELFTREGCGTLLSIHAYEQIRQATIDDVGGILELIRPLEDEGVLVRRSRELLETEIPYFTVIERDGMMIGCAALYPFSQYAEMACVVVHPDYRDQQRGVALLNHVEKQAKQLAIQHLFVLTTRTGHWFLEQGFVAGNVEQLPVEKQALYNYQRQSKVFIKKLV